MPENPSPTPTVEILQQRMVESTRAGIQSTSVDGISVTKQSAADQKIAIDEAKKAMVDRIPIMFCKWK